MGKMMRGMDRTSDSKEEIPSLSSQENLKRKEKGEKISCGVV